MDFLRTCNIEELPEQQTRTSHLIADNPDFDLSLGFDACCTCGEKVGAPETPSISCRNCRRVVYCSEVCRQQDANLSSNNVVEGDEGEQDSALGHSAIVCSLLRLCEETDAVENGEEESLDSAAIQAARNRIESEKHSYPATLSNAIMGGGFENVLRAAAKSGVLAIHVIGASTEGELWDIDDSIAAYSQALADLAESNRISLIDLSFIGPECPNENFRKSVIMDSLRKESSSSRSLKVCSVKGIYSSELLQQHEIPKPDLVAFFNPGFTVPEYSWSETLKCIGEGTPFLVTTNTELEGIADCQYLLDQDKIRSIPPGLAQIFGLYSEKDEDEAAMDGTSFFNENPFCGIRVRQNGTMANDLFVKNHWILGATMGSYDPSRGMNHVTQPVKKIRAEEANQKSNNPALV